VYPLFLIAVLTVLTLGLAHRLGLLRDTALVIGASLLGGLIVLAAHPGLAWVAEQPEDGACGLDEEELPIRVERISVAEAQALLADPTVTFVDARSANDYVVAHIPGAVSLPAVDAAGILEIQSVPILPDGRVITYCNGGACEQSEYLGLLLRDREVCKQVAVLEGGWAAWAAAGAPTVSGEGQYGSSSVEGVPG
jgi:rhodanese-related sulfurtransferase